MPSAPASPNAQAPWHAPPRPLGASPLILIFLLLILALLLPGLLHAAPPAPAEHAPGKAVTSAVATPAEGTPLRASPQSATTSDPGRISGRIVDPADAPLSTVTVTLRAAADSSVVTGILTDERGAFRLEGLPLGDYFIHVSRLGYTSRHSETIALSAGTPQVELGTIVLQVAAVALDGVEAVVDRPSVVIEADRTVYDARQMPQAQTGPVTDVLRAIPELEVDVDDNVRTRGSRPAAIHLNGRPLPIRGDDLATFLRQLPGDQVERIEVMENPSARHDPEGLGGIVNIVLREDVEIGLSGSINVNASSRGRQAVGGRFNVQRGRLTLFSGASLNRFRSDSESWTLRTNLLASPVTVIEQSSLFVNRSNGWNGDWTAEYRLAEDHVIWSNAFLFGSGSGGDTESVYTIGEEDGPLREHYDRAGDRSGDMLNLNLGVGYKWIRDPRREEFSVDLRHSGGGNESLLEDFRDFHLTGGAPVTRPRELTLSETEAGNGNLSLQADWFRPVAEAGRLDVGVRSWWRTQDSEQLFRIFQDPGISLPDESRHSGWDYEEVFRSLYATLALPRGALRFQGGLRAEFATTEFRSRVQDETFGQRYRNLFPSANVSWELRPGRIARLSYARRISRPPPFYLDPFVASTDPLNLFPGNPELGPSLSSTWTLDFSVSGSRGTLRVAPYMTLSEGVWERIRTVDEEGVSTSRWENTASSRQLGQNLTASLRPQGRLSGSASLGIFRESRDGSNIRQDLSGAAWFWRVGGNLGVRLDDVSTVQIMANRFPMPTVLQGSSSAYTMLSFSARRQILDRRGNVSLTVSDPFNMMRFDTSASDPTFLVESRSSNPSRTISLGVSLNLGQTPERHSRPASAEGAGETIAVPGGG